MLNLRCSGTQEWLARGEKYVIGFGGIKREDHKCKKKCYKEKLGITVLKFLALRKYFFILNLAAKLGDARSLPGISR